MRLLNICKRSHPSSANDKNILLQHLVFKPNDKRLTSLEGEDIDLTPHEFQLLNVLSKGLNRTYSREEILDAFADLHGPQNSRAVDIMVSRLRKKIEVNPKHPRLLTTVQGFGYRLCS